MNLLPWWGVLHSCSSFFTCRIWQDCFENVHVHFEDMLSIKLVYIRMRVSWLGTLVVGETRAHYSNPRFFSLLNTFSPEVIELAYNVRRLERWCVLVRVEQRIPLVLLSWQAWQEDTWQEMCLLQGSQVWRSTACCQRILFKKPRMYTSSIFWHTYGVQRKSIQLWSEYFESNESSKKG